MTSGTGLLEFHVHGPLDAAHVLDLPLYEGVEVRPQSDAERQRAPQIRLTRDEVEQS
ncbi:hypothetical protein ACFC1B_06765 [Streptomyces xiamenensis]|uniref:hypothetical protein n=1 Tax=Streptomyces xiamenensis TaxID=408015 RepID=UPI0035D90679